jgi:hypothetical protein
MNLKRYLLLSLKLALLSLLLILGIRQARAQEIFCNVTVKALGAEGLDKRVTEEMKKSMQDFLNLRRRTQDSYSPEEHILCNLIISITESPSIGRFKATAQIQALRPIYGASLETPMLNFLDRDWDFMYTEGMPMDFNDNSLGYTNSLTSLLSFYAYLILGLDYDTFSKLGGRQYYQKAQYIATNTGQADQGKGWRAFDGTNARFNLAENMMDQRVAPFREGLYEYYRLGLDRFREAPDEARQNVLSCMQKIKQVQQVKPMCISISTFLDTKTTEIINIFSQAQPQEKQAVYALMVQIDPTKSEKYNALVK